MPDTFVPDDNDCSDAPDDEHTGASGMVSGGGNVGETGPRWAAFGGTPGHPGVSRGGGGGASPKEPQEDPGDSP